MKPVIALSEGQQRGDKVIFRRRFVCVLVVAQPVRETVDKPRAMPRDQTRQTTSVKIRLPLVLKYDHRQSKRHEERKPRVMLRNPHGDGIRFDVRNIDFRQLRFSVFSVKNPQNMRVPKSLVWSIRVDFSVRERMVQTMKTTPPPDAPLEGRYAS